MAKAGFWLQGASGKLAGSALAKSAGGATVIRTITKPTNPQTVKQVNGRAKFKLISQLAAALSPVIAIPREGALSGRNLFTKLNSDLVTVDSGTSQITLDNVQLTKSAKGFAQITATRVGNTIQMAMADDVSNNADRVVYIVYNKNSEGDLVLIDSKVAEQPGSNGFFPATLQAISGTLVLYAYGIKDKSEKATAKYGDMYVESADDIAKLVFRREMSASDYNFTKTRGAVMYAGENEITAVPDGYTRVFVTSTNGGSVAGAGVFEQGSQVTVNATPQSNYEFLGWKHNQSDANFVSTDATYTFTLGADTVDLVAIFSRMVLPITLSNVTLDGSSFNENDYANSGDEFVVAGTANNADENLNKAALIANPQLNVAKAPYVQGNISSAGAFSLSASSTAIGTSYKLCICEQGTNNQLIPVYIYDYTITIRQDGSDQ